MGDNRTATVWLCLAAMVVLSVIVLLMIGLIAEDVITMYQLDVTEG